MRHEEPHRPRLGGIGALMVTPLTLFHASTVNADAVLPLSGAIAMLTTVLPIRVHAAEDLEALKRDDPGLVCIMMNNLAQKLLERLKETRQELKIHFLNLVRSSAY